MRTTRCIVARLAAGSLAASLLLSATPAMAGPGYYLVSVYDNEGQKSVDFKYWSVKDDGALTFAPEAGFGYSPTSRWYTEVFGTYIHPPNRETRWQGLNWQNDYLLTQGQYSFDLALHSNVERYDDMRRGLAVEFGPALQTEIGRTQFNVNLFLARNYRAETANRVQMQYQWQVKHRIRPEFELGLQGFGELGDWDHWSPLNQQAHRIGPMISGTFAITAKQAVSYELAYLSGMIGGRHARVVGARLQYLF